MNAIEALFEVLQEACLPGVWSKGVAMSRDHSILVDHQDENEARLRIALPGRPVAVRVTLWPVDEDWYCDCGDRNDPCMHIAAAVVALKAGRTKSTGDAAAKSVLGVVHYRFRREGTGLKLDRYVVYPEREEKLAGSLVSLTAGIQSGRVSAVAIAAGKEDFAVDYAISKAEGSRFTLETMTAVLKALEENPYVSLDGARVRASGKKTGLVATVTEERGGFRVRIEQEGEAAEVFPIGIALCGDVLRPFDLPRLTTEEQALFGARQGRLFARAEAGILVSRVIPSLESKLPVRVQAPSLPEARRTPPRIVLELEPLDERKLRVIPRIAQEEFAVYDEEAERALARRLQQELHLSVGQPVTFEGEAAIEFRRRAGGFEQTGRGRDAFSVNAELVPELVISEGGGFAASFRASGQSVDAGQVLAAWRSGASAVPLLGGAGWAKLPRDWLERFGKRIEALLAARTHDGRVAPFLKGELHDLGVAAGAEVPSGLRDWKKRAESFEGIPSSPLPPDLRAELRAYQRVGVDWLAFHREGGTGALLADDMGLGKTLQALCAVRGRTLIVAPTSVVYGWLEQIARFRPGMKAGLYHGAGRRLDPGLDVTVTTYGILRLERERLAAERWETIVLDEGHLIKNPESQVAQAAHALEAPFKITLSGTPVENRIDDLWSQFRFLNPGLLGTREEFQERYALPAARGDRAALDRVKQLIRPFVLRRLKRAVAPELPPRTEMVLHCELTASERELYQSLWASTRAQVVRELGEGGNLFRALEALLRLRQACAHPGLVPGSGAQGGTSSKVELLVETLEEAASEGHRALVFSQWTSLLDLIEPALAGRGLSFLRLDGSTPNRQEIVSRFQAGGADAPTVLLMSLKAGGVGLNLTAADQVFLMDPWWNPAAEDQAADRAHRIGQENPVLIQRLIAKDTIEEKILELQARKKDLAAAVLDGDAIQGTLTREDLLMLFGD